MFTQISMKSVISKLILVFSSKFKPNLEKR